MGRKLNSLMMGLLALAGVNLSSAPSTGPRAQMDVQSINSISDKTPLYLEKFTSPAQSSDRNLLAWHSSHVSHSSHYSHSSHLSHSSHYSGY